MFSRALCISLLVLFLSLPTQGEHIRGVVTQEIPLEIKHDLELNQQISVGELVVISLDQDPVFYRRFISRWSSRIL